MLPLKRQSLLRLKKLSDEIQEELSKLATKSESLRGWLEDLLRQSYVRFFQRREILILRIF